MFEKHGGHENGTYLTYSHALCGKKYANACLWQILCMLMTNSIKKCMTIMAIDTTKKYVTNYGEEAGGRILEGIWWLGPALPRRCPGANVVASCGRREAHT